MFLTQRLFLVGKIVCCLCTYAILCIRELILLKKTLGAPTPAFPALMQDFSVLANTREIPGTARWCVRRENNAVAGYKGYMRGWVAMQR